MQVFLAPILVKMFVQILAYILVKILVIVFATILPTMFAIKLPKNTRTKKIPGLTVKISTVCPGISFLTST